MRVSNFLAQGKALRYKMVLLIALMSVAIVPFVQASEGAAEGGHGPVTTFLWIAVILVFAKISGLV